MEVMRPAGGGNGLPDGPIGHGSCITILVAGVGTSFTVHTCGCGRSGLIAHWDPIASHLIHGEVMPPHGHVHASTNTPRLITFAPTRCCFYFLSFELMGWDVYFLF